MGRVWVAEQIALERRVAVKILSAELVRRDVGCELFEREARATARVDHPHVVRVVDYAVTPEGVPFLVLELLWGETLEERIQRSGPLALADVRVLLDQTADALAFAHDAGILHRDIKAENIFLQHRARPVIDVKLLDFGIAFQRARPMLHATGIVGTPAYMAPEQINGAEVDERCDLFSLGVCTYYALTGEFPYRGDSVEQLALSLSTGVFVPLSKLRPDLPAGLDGWFARALAANREERFSTSRDMVAAFELALEAERDTPIAVAASMPSIVVEHVTPRPRLARLAGMGAPVALALVIAFAKLAARTPVPAHAESTRAVAASQSFAAAAPQIVPEARVVAAEAPTVVAPAARVVAPHRDRAKPRAARSLDAGVPLSVDVVDASASTEAAADEMVIEGTEGFGNRE
jgi:serine/threonine-protein kinase